MAMKLFLLACYTVSLLATSAAAIHGASVAPRQDTPGVFSFLTFWKAGVDTKLRTTVRLGSQGTELDVVADLGSELAWVYGRNNNYTWGSHYLGGPWHCGLEASPNFNANLSTTASINQTSWHERYGGGSKNIYGNELVHDTVTFAGSTIEPGREVRNFGFYTADLTTIRLADVNCTKPPSYSSGIWGLNGIDRGSGTYLRGNIKAQGLTESNTMSVFLRNASSRRLDERIDGEVLLGGVDTSAYVGDLVVVNGSQRDNGYGYAVSIPTMSINGRQVDFGPTYNNAPCQLDTGATGDTWPIPHWGAEFLNQTGLLSTRTYYAYPAACADIPEDKTFDFTWPSKSGAKNITIKVPIRNYARAGLGEVDGACLLNFQVIGCVFGQTFLSAAYVAFDDDRTDIAFAQAGVKEGGQIAIPSGGLIPGAVY